MADQIARLVLMRTPTAQLARHTLKQRCDTALSAAARQLGAYGASVKDDTRRAIGACLYDPLSVYLWPERARTPNELAMPACADDDERAVFQAHVVCLTQLPRSIPNLPDISPQHPLRTPNL